MGNERINLNVETLDKVDFKLLYISTSKYEGDWQSLPHTHHFTELFYVISGIGKFLVEAETTKVHENDLVIINPHVEHTEMSLDSRPLEYIVFGVDGLTFTFDEGNSLKNYGSFNYTADKKHMLNFSQIMLREINDKKIGYELICHNILEVLLIYIARNYQIGITSSHASHMPKECAFAKRYLDSNYSQTITLESLAEAAHINKYYLAHTFTNFLGISPINYLIQKRLEVSKELLNSTNHSIAQIASSAGFSSQSYFSQIFKKMTGLTPNQYRKQHVCGGEVKEEKQKLI